ncbi:hypothetical protein L484_025598 [Morus notabilis]|uniref:Retrovirus-related Pol polyprotein from transposon TNT 1-94 n=1 Tax=Morus notabilis TaxID=981085 RepID=W9RJA5_9ROSA|nr:hypothetical protein L484_025598 [Morus notabilis]
MSIKKGGLTITEYLDKLKTIFDKFTAIGEPLSYRDKIIHTFRGLGPAYDSIVSSISARPDQPPMEEIHNILINRDYRLEEQQSVDNLGLTQAQQTQLFLTLSTQSPTETIFSKFHKQFQTSEFLSQLL